MNTENKRFLNTTKKCTFTVSIKRIYHTFGQIKKSAKLHTHTLRQGRNYRKRGSLKNNRGIIKNRVSVDN